MKRRTIAAAALAWTMAATGAAGQDAAAEQAQQPVSVDEALEVIFAAERDELLASGALDGGLRYLLAVKAATRRRACASGREASCFQLWDACGWISPFVTVGDNEIGVEEGAVVNAVESRLRAARVLSSYRVVDERELRLSPQAHLEVAVQFVGAAFDISVRYRKALRVNDWYGFESDGTTHTWERSTFGTHGGNSAFVMEAVRRYLDEFLNDYLRVNAPVCEARR